jgi:transcriptional regulator with XRE-family HTH domain
VTSTEAPPPNADVPKAVARNTRRLRTARGWSLDHLASRSGVSKGMLVSLEQSRTNPSLGTLCKIAETLGVSVAALVELDQAPVVRVVDPADTARLWSGLEGSAADLLVGSDEREHVELWHWTLASGDEHGTDGHADGTRELLYVSDGTLTLVVEGREHHVQEGGAALFHGDRPHSYSNQGNQTLRLVMVVFQPDADLDEWTGRDLAGQ